jgi:predicted nucleic acid-binding protein
MRIFLDANILFSAAKSDGAVRRLLLVLRRGGHKLVADNYVLEEARRNLTIKFPAGVEALNALLPTLEMVEVHAANSALSAKLPLPEKDKPVLLASISARCQVLVTGDQSHFGSLFGKRIGGVVIHSPRSLAEEILRGP